MCVCVCVFVCECVGGEYGVLQTCQVLISGNGVRQKYLDVNKKLFFHVSNTCENVL